MYIISIFKRVSASTDQGGGYYTLTEGQHGSDNEEMIELKIGDREVKAGGEVFLDYGDRNNEDWMMYYGFLPDRNSAESVVLPVSRCTITWDCVDSGDEDIENEGRILLDRSSTTLRYDIEALNDFEMDKININVTMALALKC